MQPTQLWSPTLEQIVASNTVAFIHAVNARHGLKLDNYHDLYAWSVERLEDFWVALWDFAGVIAKSRGEVALEHRDVLQRARFFPQAELNFAENLLMRHHAGRSDVDALVFWGEDRVRRRVSHLELHNEVSRVQQALKAAGVRAGDRIAGFMPNIPETVVAMLAATSLGATWTSCSPDFGVQGVVDRFGQVEPTVLFACDGYWYNGKPIDAMARVAEISHRLPTVKRVVVVPYLNDSGHPAKPPLDVSAVRDGIAWTNFVESQVPRPLEFVRLPFSHPLYILYSSGTTGVPKCIVHGAGGALLMHLKEHQLHCDVRPGDKFFYYTTCGWMMWNWLVTGLASGATLLLYDGSPFARDGRILFDYADAEDMTHMGTSAKFIDALAKAGVAPRETHDLKALRLVLSTGSPLVPESFDYVYDKIKSDVCLSSMSGGTDLIASFAGGCPILPVWRGEIQCRALGMKVEVFDDQGRPARGEKGELVCTAPFPTMPLGFWNDPGDRKYHATYYERFANVWHHGDWCQITEHGGMVIYGRSDAVLNPGGIRIGTAEIYRQVEKLDEVAESLVIGQNWPPGQYGDVRVVLFVRLKDGIALNDDLSTRIKDVIRANTTSRHVPAKILQVPDIPRTKSGKIVELAVRAVVHGEVVKNEDALANPEALKHFRNRLELVA